MNCQEAEWWDEFTSIWGAIFGDSRLSCACCGGTLPSIHKNGWYGDDDELKCEDCNSTNFVSIDEDDGPYISFYRCEHGLRDDSICDLCEGSS